ncbi:carbohydrate kinase family protein [Candidatus Microgenomates bacterium]|nr:carbohydrate kinase family protein [Candidatus Microgenomates bacterium]
MESERTILTGIGNIYVETNYLGLRTAGKDVLEVGKEYRAGKYETRLGGSVVNFITQAKRLGINVGLIGKCGDDEMGKRLIELLETEGIATEFIIISPGVQTSVDTGIVFEHSGSNIQLVAGNANQELCREDIDLNSRYFDQVKAVYLGGFLKQESLYKDYPQLLQDMI